MRYDSRTRVGTDLGLFALRAVAGTALAWHGTLKFLSEGGWTNWMGSEAVFPSWAQAVAAVAETAGGAGIAVGLFTRLAAVGVLSVMGGALYMHVSRGDPFVSAEGAAWEYAAVLFATGFLCLLHGGGRFSLDALFGRSRHEPAPAILDQPEPPRPRTLPRPDRTPETVRADTDRYSAGPPLGPMGT
jgi:putative oxidoreductase